MTCQFEPGKHIRAGHVGNKQKRHRRETGNITHKSVWTDAAAGETNALCDMKYEHLCERGIWLPSGRTAVATQLSYIVSVRAAVLLYSIPEATCYWSPMANLVSTSSDASSDWSTHAHK